MKLKRKKIARNIGITLVLILLMGCSVAFGVGYSQQITAYFYNIQVKLNGNTLNFSNQPFIYNDSVYIPLRDVSQNLGIKVTWEGNTKTVYLVDNSTANSTSNSTSNNTNYVLMNNKDADDIEKDLNNNYEKYTKGYKDLEFKYKVAKQFSYIKVEMDGKNFERDSSNWEKRDSKKFQDFIENIAKRVANELDKDVKIYVEDEDGKDVGKYEYDESKKDFKVTSEYGKSGDIDDVEDSLKDKYDEYKRGDTDLEFKYSLDDKSSYIKVEMEGENFKRDSSAWEKRSDSKFKDFIEDIAKEVADELDKDVKIEIEDKDGKDVAEYEYDESKKDFEVKEEYGEKNDGKQSISDVEEKLNDDYDKYTKGQDDLKFDYSLDEKSSYIEVEMKGKNFDRKSSDWDKRDKSEFKDFIEDVIKEVHKAFDDEDVKVTVDDEDGHEAAEYYYDESKDDFEVKDEYND